MKAGYVSIVGKPNVGKSTLLNRLIGSNISIITPKPQTTRNRILGIWTEENNQIIFIDTPGKFKPGNEMESAMQQQIKTSINDSDAIMLMIDHRESSITDSFPSRPKKPTFLIINKIDLISEKDLDKIIENIDLQSFDKVFTISALRGDNADKIIPSLLDYLPEGEPLYPEDFISDRPERFFIEEFVRERILYEYSQEIPYSVAVKVENMENGRIDIKIFVEKESQKGIIIGKGGEKLKKVVSEARKNIENFLGRPVYMSTWVAVKKNWRKEKEEVKRLGYYE
ncbi:GTPase Era [candidate division WOR-3 bacterium]|nr:GTPase Era [candidate division WOR-3 bacterium]